MAKDHGPSIKDNEQYEALRKEGMSKEMATRIANTPRREAAMKGGERPTRSGLSMNSLRGHERQASKAGRAWPKTSSSERCDGTEPSQPTGSRVWSHPTTGNSNGQMAKEDEK
jgi:hypothetical protein